MDASGCFNEGKHLNGKQINESSRYHTQLKILTSPIIIYSGELILSGNDHNEAAAHCSPQIIQSHSVVDAGAAEAVALQQY